MEHFACNGATTFLSIPFLGGGAGCEGARGIKLEEVVDWRGESKAPQAVWLIHVGEKPGQGQRKAVMGGLRAFWEAPRGA